MKTVAALGRTEIGFALDIFVSIIVYLVSLIDGYKILGPQIEYANCKSEKMRLELKMLLCSPVPNRGLARN